MTNVEHSRSFGRIITFYSYKGGTGRTMAMANVAWLLASNGYRVLAIDWDLESPGLHRYLHPFIRRDKELLTSHGVIDLIRNYADAVVHPGALAQGSGPDTLTQIEEYVIPLNWQFPAGGGIDFVPAGLQDDAYATKVSTFSWNSFWERLHGGAFIDALRDRLRASYDFVLIDSRTGTSDTAGICTIQLPDTVVNCFTLNRQSIDGAWAITRSIHHQRAERPITVYPLPTRIEDGEKEKLDRGRAYARRMLAPFLALPDGEDPDAYWNAVEVPYIPYYAYEEMLAAFGDSPRQENTLLARYQRLASRLAGHECDPPLISERERIRVRRQFEHSAQQDPLKVLVAYAPLDRIWAEWIQEQLNAAGQVAQLYCVHDPLPAVEQFDRLVTVISRDYLSFDDAGPLWRLGAEHAAGDSRFLVGVRVDAAPLGQHTAPRSMVDVLGVAEERALQMLLRALGLDVQTDDRQEPDRQRPGIRYPAIFARHFNVQLERNPRFSGRGRMLGEIRDRLLRGGPAGARLALTGLPGIGKTQLALEYVYRFAASYDILWWISAERSDRVRIVLSNLGERLKIASTGGNLEDQVKLVLDALSSATQRWLIVFDNANDPEAITDLLPSGPGHVLVTSRNPQWSRRLDSFEVDVFQRRESVELLARRVPGIPTEDAERLAKRLGDLPLAVEQAGGWISTTGMPVSDYLRVLDAGLAKAMDEGVPAGYRQTITATVRVALHGLRKHNLAAARLIELFSFLAPVLISYRLVNNKRLIAFLTTFDAKMHDPLLHSTLVSEIGRYALARVDSGNGGLVVHRLTQEIIRSELSQTEERERREEVQAILAAVDRGDSPDDPKNWPAYELLRPHLEPAGVLDSASPEVRQLVIDMTRYLHQRGDYRSSTTLARTALARWTDRFGPDDSSTLMLRFQLAVALRAAGDEEEAYRINRDSHERLVRTVGARHPYTLMTAFSLAADLRVRGEYHEARERDEATAQAMREVLQPDHPQTLAAVNNLAVSLWLVGRFREAAEHFRESHQGRRKVLGPDHPFTLVSAVNYGGTIRELGDLRGSRNTLETAVEATRRVLGDDHPYTLRAAMDFVVTCRRLGEVDTVSALIADTIARYERILRRNHPQAISCRIEQACVLWAMGRYRDARRTAEEAYEQSKQEFGPQHPHTLAAGNDLGIFRRASGDLEASRRLAEKTADRLQAALGPRHPYTLVGLLNLANALYADGARAEARQRDEEVYGRLRGVLDDDHPTVLAAAANHAISHRVHDPEKGAALLADVVQRYQDVLGPEHPDTRAARESNRIDVDIAPLPL